MSLGGYLIKIDSSIDESNFHYLLKYVQLEKKERILKQRIKQNADNMLIGEILAKVVIKKSFGIDIAEQEFSYAEYGKPYLMKHPDVHCNVSHSGEYVVCAILDTPVGVDVQKIGEYKQDVARRVCNDRELAQIEKSTDKAAEFARLWTQKEAVLKMYGTGICNTNIENCLKNEDFCSKRVDDYWLSFCAKID